jgi:ABC-2 type transport system permease protein
MALRIAMFSQARAILEAQFRTLVNFYSRGHRTGLIITAIMSVVWYGLCAIGGLSIALLYADGARTELVRRTLPFGLMVAFLYWQIVPLMLASAGASLDMKRLVVYPITHNQLFSLEVLLRLSTGVEMILLLAGAAAGIVLNPRIPNWAPLGFLPFILINLFISAGLRDWLGRLLVGRRRREFAILFVVLLAAAPQILLLRGIPSQLRAYGEQISVEWFPWVLTARIASGETGAIPWIGLIGWTLMAFSFGRWQFERNFRFDADEARATVHRPAKRPPWSDNLFRLPSRFFGDPLGAIVEKEMRFLSRAPRFRLVFFMGFSFGLLVWLPLALQPDMANSAYAANYLTFVTVYALMLLGEVSFWNTFGFDRSAAQFYYLAPVQFSTVVLGKNIASAVFVLLEVAAVTVACAVLGMPISLPKTAEAFGVAVVLSTLLIAAGNLGSVYYPRPVNPAHTWRSSGAGKMQALLLFLYPVFSIPIGLAYLARFAFDSALAFWGILAVGGCFAWIVYRISMDSVLEAAEARKEIIIGELSQGDSPVMN